MQNDEITDDVQVEQQENETAAVEETSAEENAAESQSDETTLTPEAELAKAKAEAAKYRRLFEKGQTSKPLVAKPKAPQTASPLNVEETVLLANGMSEDLMVELKAVAQVRKISLIKAQTDPIFVAVKDKFEKDKKRDEASLPASRSSGSVKARKSFNTPGLTKEEHMALIKARG